jgi:23S rRNA pseudouridine2605 synthase
MTEPKAAERLQKVLAAAGIGSRRACEVLIADGRVTVDGRTATLGDRVDPQRQRIHVDGQRIPTASDLVVLAFNKPAGVVTSMADDLGRPCVGDYVVNRTERLFHVGRLDVETEGLLLLTNDGTLAQHLTHPRYGIPKTYLATVPGPVRKGVLAQLKKGVDLEDEDRPVVVDEVRVVQTLPTEALIEVVIHEGRNHVVRRLLEQVGYPVLRLVRTQVGPIRLGQQRPGTVRVLSSVESGSLYSAVSL